MDIVTGQAIDWCISHNVPFSAFREPEKSEITFYSAPTVLTNEINTEGNGFIIGEFDRNLKECYFLPFELDAAATLELKPKGCDLPTIDLPSTSTDYNFYISSITGLIKKLAERGEAKTVISRVEACQGNFDALSAFENITRKPSALFCSLCYHPKVGFWCGATPELLLAHDSEDSTFSTIALAGTIMRGQNWDDKNQREQKIVSDYVANTLRVLDVDFIISKVEVMPFGNLEHLCTRFRGYCSREKAFEIINGLNPTPALCGYPLSTALSDIQEIETEPRGCYGGMIGFKKGKDLKVYVNIRCVNFDKTRYVLRAGGGILADSVPDAEWLETQRKIASLQALFNE